MSRGDPLDPIVGKPFEQDGAAPIDEQTPIEDAVEFEIPATTAPVFPREDVLHNSAAFYQRVIGGGMHLKFVPLVGTPAGLVPSPHAWVVEFSPDGWERFKADVARDGERSQIETVRTFPGGLLNGDGK